MVNGEPALNQHWFSVVLSCSGHRHRLEIVMNIKYKPNYGTQENPNYFLLSLQPSLNVKGFPEV